MLNLYPGLSAGPNNDDYRICYAILVSCVSLLLFCVLVASVSVPKACIITGMILVFFVVIGWFAPAADGAGNSSTQQGATPHAVPGRCVCGVSTTVLDAIPSFAYECPAKSGDKEESGMLCSVCLEAVQGGAMVRQLPTCKHLFHVECIDMWLHSHKTCPLCRCDIQRSTMPVKAAATAESSTDALPPV